MSLIYQPKGRAGEYSALACNVYSGCDHGCIYCYAPKVVHKTRGEFARSKLRPNFLRNLRIDAKRLTTKNKRVLLSFTTDPYQVLDVTEKVTRETIKILKANHIPFQILTKGGKRALRDIDLYDFDRDSFASTLTVLDHDQSRRWEPHGANPDDRIETLKTFHSSGIFTWVSLEPVLDPEQSLEIIKATHKFVDHYKVGTINYSRLSDTINWTDFGVRALKLLNRLGKSYYIKHDLRKHLPMGTVLHQTNTDSAPDYIPETVQQMFSFK